LSALLPAIQFHVIALVFSCLPICTEISAWLKREEHQKIREGFLFLKAKTAFQFCLFAAFLGNKRKGTYLCVRQSCVERASYFPRSANYALLIFVNEYRLQYAMMAARSRHPLQDVMNTFSVIIMWGFA
jgi:hypothetical protein